MALESLSLAVIEAVASHAMASGYFGKVNQYEPKSAPPDSLMAAVWINDYANSPAKSGLNSTSMRLEITVRIYSNMLAEPQDMIDPKVLEATDALFAAYSGDFTLDGLVRNVDLMGEDGRLGLRAQAGYVQIGDQRNMFRVMTITVPVIINDVYEQGA